MRSMCRVLIKKTRLQCATKTDNLHVRLMRIVLEQVPCRWSSDSKGAMAVRIELKPWNNEQMAAGGTKMLSFSNLSDRCAQLRQIIRCLAMQAFVHRHPKLVCDSICHIEPMQLRVKRVCQAVVVLLHATDKPPFRFVRGQDSTM